MSTPYVEDALVQPIAPDRPCGEDLEDTPLLASFDAFRVFGQSAPHDPVPEWSTIASRATEALCKSKDLRLLAYLGSAVLRTDGLPAFAETLTIASAWLGAPSGCTAVVHSRLRATANRSARNRLANRP